MAKYSIQDTTLTAIGDAIRNKTGEHTRVEYIPKEVWVFKTDNVNSLEEAMNFDTTQTGGFKKDIEETIVIPGAVKLVLQVVITAKYADMRYELPEYSDSVWYRAGSINRQLKEYEIMGDTITIKVFNAAFSYGNNAFYAEARGYDEDGNLIKDENTLIEIEVPNTLTPAQMAAEIEALHVYYPPEEAFKFTGDCQYKFADDSFTWFIQDYGDKITTEEISNVSNMFRGSQRLTKIPFEINLTTKTDDLGSMFYGCYSLTDIANINVISVKKASSLFGQCQSLRKLPDCVLTWDLTAMNGYAYGSSNSMFQNCYSLRNIPSEFLKKLYGGGTSYSYHLFYNFNDLLSIDELIGLPVSPAAFTSNIFNNGFKNFWRAKELIFDTNADGSVKTVTWKNQSVKLDQYVGYVNKNTIYEDYITDSNNGITADKEVKDDATYQTLKNDPDWFTRDINYSRYNHDSAVNTINSLPDVSSGSGNTITFTGASGALTDGGAISNLTEEEIAVAAAKGWTVTLV